MVELVLKEILPVIIISSLICNVPPAIPTAPAKVAVEPRVKVLAPRVQLEEVVVWVVGLKLRSAPKSTVVPVTLKVPPETLPPPVKVSVPPELTSCPELMDKALVKVRLFPAVSMPSAA